MNWIDVHAHLNMLDEGVEAAIEAAQKAGVAKIITIGTEPSDLDLVLEISKKNYPHVYCTLGIHPHDGVSYNTEIGRFIEANLTHPWVLAIGEIGLDYYYDQSPREEQRQAFRAQLEIAHKHNMPVEIHTRDAEQDTVDILKEFKGEIKGLVHCFTGTSWLAEQALDLGLDISISGVVTFKNAEDLRNTVRMIPLDRLHVETDAPFLAPVPQRGKKNTPAFVVHTGKFVAQLKGVSEQDLMEQTKKNALRVFPKLVW